MTTFNLVRSATQPALTQQPIVAAITRTAKVTSAIEPDTRFFIPKDERTKHALYFYNNKMAAGRRAIWLWASMITLALYPKYPQKVINPKIQKETDYIWKMYSTSWNELGLSASPSVRKDLTRKVFIVRVPIGAFPKMGHPSGLSRFTVSTVGGNATTQPAWKELVEPHQEAAMVPNEYDLADVAPQGCTTAKDLDHFRKANGRIIIQDLGGGQATAAFLQLEFTQRESEFLCNSAWLEIRPLDFFGVIRAWTDGYYGARSRSPAFSIPIARIAKSSDAKQSKPRLSADGLLMDEHGTIVALPAKLNQISGFEDKAAAAYAQEDGSYSAVGVDGRLKTPPSAMPVYVDWVNLKFAYTTLGGDLVIKNLDRSQPVNISHIRRFLEKKFQDDTVLNFISYSVTLAAFFQLKELQTIGTVGSLLAHISKEGERRGEYLTIEETPLITMFEYARDVEGDPCQAFCDMALKLREFIRENPVNAYAKYSVPTVTELLGLLTVFTVYARKFGEVKAEDNTRRSPYENQGEDPKWKLDPVPFVLPERGLMPHQFGVQNKLRGCPDNAFMPVDAGGGKTTLVVYEILKMMKDNDTDLFMIMCPAHLVAQYVKEFVYFTGSQVNIIPVTTYTIRRHGLQRLGQMILNSPKNTVVVTDYNAIVYRQSTLAYGATPVTVFPIIDFLRQFQFKYVAADESHFLKNGSSRNAAAGRLFIEIQKKRLASGTMVSNTITDLVRQTALMDPSVFGTVDDFVKEYALETKGSKVTEWKPGAELAVQRVLNKNIVIAGAKRKEWAAILPFPKEKFHTTTMSANQLKCYQDILTSIQEELQKAAENDEKLRKALNNELEDDNGDEISLDVLLKPYLARLERFLTAPGLDVLGKVVLKGEDLVSPKVLKIIDICKEHIAEGISGKVLIFTNYENSAIAIYDAFPPELKDKVIYYTAGEKEACGAEFERNPNKLIMVGIEQSMNTGLNLQFCFPGHTQVLLDKKRSMTMQDIYSNPDITEVLSYDLASKKIQKRKILRKIKSRVKASTKYVSVRVVDNKTGVKRSLILTDGHQLFLKGGSESKAKDLQPGDQLITFGGKTDTVRSCPDTQEVMHWKSYQHYRNVTGYICLECGEMVKHQAKLKHDALHGNRVEEYEALLSTKSANGKNNWLRDRDGMMAGVELAKSHPNQSAESRSAYVQAGWDNDGGTRRARISEATVSRWADPEFKARVGEKISEALLEISDILSANSILNWLNPEYRAKVIESNKAAFATPRYKKLRSELSKAMWADPEMRQQILSSMAETNATEETSAKRSAATRKRHADDPEFTLKSTQAMLDAQMRGPSRPEIKVMDMGVDNLKYVGFGNDRYWTSIKFRGEMVRKNPDFISLNHQNEEGRVHRVVEVIGARSWTNRDAKYDRDLIKAYKNSNIECLIIDEDELKKPEDLEDVEARLQSFVNNHYLTVESVKPYTTDNVIGEFKYDLEVEGDHNYFALAGNTDTRSHYKGTPVLVHNCSRLIRVETVWTPGTLEQGNSRIGRPNIKDKETRPFVYYDWLLANYTIDVTKISYLMAKTISKAKFDEAGNPPFDDLEVPPLFSMTLDNVFAMNDLEQTLLDYFTKYQTYKQTLYKEFADFKEKNKDKLFTTNAKGEQVLKMFELAKSAAPTGSAVMRLVPYVPGTELYRAADLGLIRYDAFMRLDTEELEAAEEEDEKAGKDVEEDTDAEAAEDDSSASDEKKAKLIEERNKAIGLSVHTEFGTGEIISLNGRTLKVQTESGGVFRVNKLAAFVVTRASTSNKDLRTQLLKLNGDLPIDTPIDIEETGIIKQKKLKKVAPVVEEVQTEAAIEMVLDFTIVNDFLGIRLVNIDNEAAVRVAQGMGFKHPPAYFAAKIPRPRHLLDLFKMWNKLGFEIDEDNSRACEVAYKHFYANRMSAPNFYGVATENSIRNFYKLEFKPNPSKVHINPYPLIQDDELYIGLPKNGHPGSVPAIQKARIPGIKWFVYGADEELIAFTPKKEKASALIKSLLDQGIVIPNIKDLVSKFRKLRIARDVVEL